MKTVSFTDFSAFPPVIFRRETVELQCCVKWKQSFIQKKSVFIQENFLAGEKNSYLRKNLKPVIETRARKKTFHLHVLANPHARARAH